MSGRGVGGRRGGGVGGGEGEAEGEGRYRCRTENEERARVSSEAVLSQDSDPGEGVGEEGGEAMLSLSQGFSL